MLKIKDNVDLKELEKFGFKKSTHNIWFKDFTNNGDIMDLETAVVINPNYKECERQIVFNTFYEDSGIDASMNTDIIYDLIKADLVEKVDD